MVRLGAVDCSWVPLGSERFGPPPPTSAAETYGGQEAMRTGLGRIPSFLAIPPSQTGYYWIGFPSPTSQVPHSR